MKKEVAP